MKRKETRERSEVKVRGQRSEVRSQKSEIRDQRSDIRYQRLMGIPIQNKVINPLTKTL